MKPSRILQFLWSRSYPAVEESPSDQGEEMGRSGLSTWLLEDRGMGTDAMPNFGYEHP